MLLKSCAFRICLSLLLNRNIDWKPRVWISTKYNFPSAIWTNLQWYHTGIKSRRKRVSVFWSFSSKIKPGNGKYRPISTKELCSLEKVEVHEQKYGQGRYILALPAISTPKLSQIKPGEKCLSNLLLAKQSPKALNLDEHLPQNHIYLEILRLRNEQIGMTLKYGPCLLTLHQHRLR